jgi:hypothetical protein
MIWLLGGHQCLGPIRIWTVLGLALTSPTFCWSSTTTPASVRHFSSSSAAETSSGFFSKFTAITVLTAFAIPMDALPARPYIKPCPAYEVDTHPACLRASSSEVKKKSISPSILDQAPSNFTPEKGFSASEIAACRSGESVLGALNFSSSSRASNAFAFASAVSLRNWSPWVTKAAIRSLDSSSDCFCNFIMMAVDRPTTTAAVAATPRNETITTFQASRSRPNIRLTLLETIVFSVCVASIAAILAMVVWVWIAYWRDRRVL